MVFTCGLRRNPVISRTQLQELKVPFITWAVDLSASGSGRDKAAPMSKKMAFFRQNVQLVYLVK